MSFTDIYGGPHDLLVGLFYVVCFGALQCDGMFRCACTLLSAQVMFAGLAFLERTFSTAVKQGVSEATDGEDADSKSVQASESEADSASDSDASASESESDDASEIASEDACNQDMLEKADKVLTAEEKEVDAAQAELFYRMFVRGVLEFVHDGHVFSIDQRVRVKTINE